MSKLKDAPYSKFKSEELILRDHLAIDRTVLSNESTILAYIRTSVAIAAAGATIIHFLSGFILDLIGTLLIIVAFVVLIIGLFRYKKMDKQIKEIREN